MRTEKAIYEMMIEPTGKHMLDSGGSDNRHWQKNQGKTLKDFMNEPAETYHKDKQGYFDRSVSTFHFLRSMGLEIDKLSDKFNNINANANDWDADADVYGVSKDAWEYLTEMHEVSVYATFNTYNNDSDLTQVLQGSWLTIDDEAYLLVQVHGGADVRGGYTNARLFKAVKDREDYIAEYKSQGEIQEELDMGLIHLEM